ncbi:replication initiation protein, partial [Salmonella enterica]|uniref:replication initiation protein n=2 Tax=Salmonella TaxID=590 RepID=UPI0020C3FE00
MNLLSVTKKTKIRHRNEINSTFSSLPLSARRILFMAMAQIDSREELSEGATFRITAREYAFIADIDVTGAYRQLKEGAEELQASVIRIPRNGTVAKLAMRQPFVLFKGLTFQKLCLP